MAFVHDTLPQRVLLGAGQAAAHVGAELARLGASAVMLIAPEREHRLVDDLGDLGGTLRLRWTQVTQHVPVELAERARAAAGDVDVVVAVGGGSAIGLAKAVALTRPVRIVAVPTTYAGSEATDVWGLTDAAGKRTGADPRVLPVSVVYDPHLVASLPPELAVASGLNAVAHCVDSLWAPRADPLNAALAVEGLRALADGLVRLVSTGTGHTDAAGHTDACALTQYGCYLAGVAFASAGSALHHKICHVLGGRFDLPHAATHAVVLPHVLAYNAPAAPAAARRIAQALGAPSATQGLAALRTRVHAPRALRDLGLREDDLPEAVDLVLPAVPASNPRPIDAASLHRLLHDAWAGTPTTDPTEAAS